MAGSEDQLDAWLVSGIQKKERQANTVHASSERLVSNDPGNGEAALKSIASWMGTRPKLPIVEFANLSRRTVTLTFAEPAVLPDPWVAPTGSREADSVWGITLEHAESLQHAENYGWQFSGLTGIGTLSDQSRALLNTTRWEILGIAGTPQWVRTLMLTQVMNQAAEPWSNDHDIWLVGYEETGDKLMNFLSAYHPVHRLHSVTDLGDIPPKELRSGSATIYVMGADALTLDEFNSLDVSGVGLITDRIISDKAMFLTERDGKAAAIGPFNTNLEIFPNYMPELIEAMDRAWDANAKLAADQVAQADFEQFFAGQKSTNAEKHKSKTESVASVDDQNVLGDEDPTREDEDLNLDLAESEVLLSDDEGEEPKSGVKKSSGSDDTEIVQQPTVDDDTNGTELSHEEKEELEGVFEQDEIEDDVENSSNEVQEPSHSDDEDANEDDIAEATNDSDSNMGDEIDEVSGDEPVAPSEPIEVQPVLSLFGKATYINEGNKLTGRNAEVLALLKLTSTPLTSQAVSELLWSGDDPTGNSARVRRARLLAKVREIAGEEAIDTTGEHWILNHESVVSDIEQLASYLDGDINASEGQIMALLETIDNPLVGSSAWADSHRPVIRSKAKKLLAEAVTKSLEQDAFVVAKAAQMASKKLEED